MVPPTAAGQAFVAAGNAFVSAVSVVNTASQGLRQIVIKVLKSLVSLVVHALVTNAIKGQDDGLPETVAYRKTPDTASYIEDGKSKGREDQLPIV